MSVRPHTNAPSVSLLTATPQAQVLLPTAQVKLITDSGDEIIVRAILDGASQASFVTRKLTKMLGKVPLTNKTNIQLASLTQSERLIIILACMCIQLSIHLRWTSVVMLWTK